MSGYPTLEEMGIQRPNEIDHYTLRPDGKNRDILRIYYKRDKNSLLPKRKTFRFGRALKVHTPNDPKNQHEVYEISPFVQKACEELETLLGEQADKQSQATFLVSRIEELESELQALTGELKNIIKSM